MAKRKPKRAEQELNAEILIGFVNSFNFNDKDTEIALGGHPTPGRLYQLIKDDIYGYRLHIGPENNPAGMSGILLGEDLVGEYDNKWSYDISIVTKENFLNFSINEEDATKMGEWFSTGNDELKKVIEQPVNLISQSETGELTELGDLASIILDDNPQQGKMVTDVSNKDIRYSKFSDDLNTIMEKDTELFDCIVDLVSYLRTTYGDKYEATTRPNIGRDFLLGSQSGDTACFNSIKYLQRYCTVGFEKSNNPKDLYKAVHYILFELQRRSKNA